MINFSVVHNSLFILLSIIFILSIFQYNDQIIKSRNKDIYDQVEVGKKYNARIKILIHNDQTENYDVAEIISGIKK